MTLVYLHGLNGSAQSHKAGRLREALGRAAFVPAWRRVLVAHAAMGGAMVLGFALAAVQSVGIGFAVQRVVAGST